MNNHPDNTPDASDAGPLLTAHALNELFADRLAEKAAAPCNENFH